VKSAVSLWIIEQDHQQCQSPPLLLRKRPPCHV
jgi:hypothetical protein